ncbi:MAG: ABC transporter substrate-binding protein [Lachnospiraceae bacterium]|jgi:peptide/nickel transport system substrate-binding protein|nr:ABC transporter substrate-binding protein [Lachnospiraceae bacterium]
MKKCLAAFVAAAMTVGVMAGCSAQVKEKPTEAATAAPATTAAPAQTQAPADGQATTEAPTTAAAKAPVAAPKVAVLTNVSYGDEAWADVIVDQLNKAGFEAEKSLQPDTASWRQQVEAKNFDLAITYWNTVTGSPDYALRSVWHSEGPLNLYGINDPHVDELIELAASQTPEEYEKTYDELDEYIVEEMAYVIPIYNSRKTLAANQEIMKPETVRLSKSRSMCWEELRFQDESKNDTDPFIMSQSSRPITPVDPVRSDDGSTFMLNTNLYIRMVNLTDDDQITTDSTLSREYAIGESGSDFYFLLRDDVFFAAVKDGHAVNTGERVGAEDAVYSMDRMMNKDSVPDHKNFSNFTAMDKNEIVTDVESLKGIASKEAGKSVYDVLNAKSLTPIQSLTDDKTKVDPSAGTYQVVHMTTKYAFPQILNVLAHSSGGIVNKAVIEEVNKSFIEDPSSFDAANDTLYGAPASYTDGSTYNNNLVVSGPYIPIRMTDTEVTYEANPGYMPTEEKFAPKIKNFKMLLNLANTDAQLNALRDNQIYVMYTIPTAQIENIKNDGRFVFKEVPSNAYNYLAFNFSGKFADIDLRKAALYAIDQEQISAVFNNRLIPTYGPATPVMGAKKALKVDLAKSAEYLQAWKDKQ